MSINILKNINNIYILIVAQREIVIVTIKMGNIYFWRIILFTCYWFTVDLFSPFIFA